MSSDNGMTTQQYPSAYPETPPALQGSLLQQHQQAAVAQHQLAQHQAAQQQAPQQQQQNVQQQVLQQHAYPATVPTTPLNHASPQSLASPSIKISPEALANLTASGNMQTGSPFSGAGSVVSPTGSTFSAGNASDPLGGEGQGGAGYSRASAMALAGAMGMNATPSQVSAAVNAALGHHQLGLDVDMAFTTSPAQSQPGSTGASTPSNGSTTAMYYAPQGSNSLPTQLSQSSLPPPSHPAPTLASSQRHHPYAHPNRPSLAAQHNQSTTSVPLYLSTPSPAPSAAAQSTASPQSAGPDPPANSIALGLPPVAPQGVQRVHSAPAHILTLATQGLSDVGSSPLPSADSEAQGAMEQRMYVGEQQQQQQPQQSSMGSHDDGADRLRISTSSTPSTTPGPPALGPAFGHSSTPISIDTLSASNAISSLTAPASAPPSMDDERLPTYNEGVSAAITLLQKRLPIMEAALSTSEVESGQDEEEIWKGIEGAYDELKRIMGERKDGRRVAMADRQAAKNGKRSFSTMELESPVTPVTPVDRDRPSFLTGPPPPLLHTMSSPDIPLSAAATAARNIAALQKAQAQAQMQQAQMQQAQAQAEAHARLVQDAERARAEAEQRARAEEELRQQQQQRVEAEAQARADAEAEAAQQQLKAEQAMREMEQYQQVLHEEQLRLARERLHQQMQEGATPGVPPTLPNPPPPTPTPTPTQQQPPQQPAQQSQQQQPLQPAQIAHPGQIAYTQPPQYGIQLQPAQPGAPPLVAIPANAVPAAITQPLYTQGGQPSGYPQYTPGIDPLAIGGDMNMMHLSGLGGFAGAMGGQSQQPQQPDSVDPALTSGIAPSTVSPPMNSTSIFANAASGGPGPVRPSRSRAASQSGYTSSGSRSRAASGSGYQALLESRSRAASSASSVYQMFERDDEDEMDDEAVDLDQVEVGGTGPAQSKVPPMGAASAGVEPELKAVMDPIFFEFLADICSNLDATDSKGEPIHQTLMAKKMEKLDQSHDFRPFRFRIQAFTTAFADRLAASGIFDQEVPIKKVRQYLWAQPYISRFNDDGKKAKSKGNHIWTVEAKKVPDKKWIFREFTRCIKGNAPPIAFIGLPWTWAPRVWDPQCSSAAIDASFSSPSLPDWLSWEDNVLSGEVPKSAHGQTIEVEAVATFQMGDRVHQLRATTQFLVASPDETDDPANFGILELPKQKLADSLREVKEEQKPNVSTGSSQLASPSGLNPTLYRSPSAGSVGLLEPPAPNHVLSGAHGGSYPASGSGTPGNILEPGFVQLDQQQLHDQQQFIAQLQQQAAAANDMQVDDQQAARQAQAALHQHYASLAMQQGQSFESISPGQLSYAPAPELVQNALQDAAIGVHPTLASLNTGMLSHATPEIGTPGGIFHLHEMGQQPPFTLDPSQL
ncbi:hypothetical protein NBRC10512_006315 [Rhodotorula toruloides]|uniref:RHTO0S07e02762g1_1 n=2 Tax=Rhodotorula toruloides TaxID=5286 RepID=A0A061AZL2_RHOTO|nr:uncharacterized protein RHTO_02786 [Rhodotorula toruloides NP11]EMS25059.1 hypothetical protein RHTO_02786 [Rhodotorula toruloides NP11]CDR42667.1 RHTO0S07e02762g1_1 [Rhodotorula toruloides]